MKHLQKHHYILIVAALILNACGFIFRLFIAPGPYDEIAHVFTPFVITYLIYTFAVIRYKQVDISNSIPLLLSIACISITLCVLWEIFEWSVFLYFPTDPTHDLDDTITDLIYGAIGSSSITLIVHMKQQFTRARAQKRLSRWNLSPQQAFEQMLKQNENLY